MRKLLLVLAVSSAALAVGPGMSTADAMPAAGISPIPAVEASQPLVQPAQYYRDRAYRRHQRRYYRRHYRRYYRRGY